MATEDVQIDILAKIERLALGLGFRNTSTTPDFVAFTTHTPFNLMVSNEAIGNGFYQRLYALNGQRNTFLQWRGMAGAGLEFDLGVYGELYTANIAGFFVRE